MQNLLGYTLNIIIIDFKMRFISATFNTSFTINLFASKDEISVIYVTFCIEYRNIVSYEILNVTSCF